MALKHLGLTKIEPALKRDRVVAIAALAFVSALAWAWTLHAAHAPMDAGMTSMQNAIGSMAAWSPGHAVLMLVMWWIMMVAMMLPSAAPLVLLTLAVHRRKSGTGRPEVTGALVAAGYLGVWALFSVGATLLQWGLESMALLSAMSMRTGPVLAGVILLSAGLYQLTPAKRACLRHCRSPMRFVVEGWRPGAMGAIRLGLSHGAYCVGCCWMLMAILFAGGVMNPFWIGAIALWVLMEKLAPHGNILRHVAGALLIISALLIFLGAI